MSAPDEPLRWLRNFLHDVVHFSTGAGIGCGFLNYIHVAEIFWSIGAIAGGGIVLSSVGRIPAIDVPGHVLLPLAGIGGALLVEEPQAAIFIAVLKVWSEPVGSFIASCLSQPSQILSGVQPRNAIRRINRQVACVNAGELRTGDEVVVQSNAILPVDGIVLDPVAHLDPFPLTGLGNATARRSGESVLNGWKNAGILFRMRATATAANSTLALDAAFARYDPSTQQCAFPCAPLFRCLLSLFQMATALFVGGLVEPLYGVAILIMSTSAHLRLAPDLHLIGSLMAAFRSGAIVRGDRSAVIMRRLAGVRTIIFEKGGVLTEGGARFLSIETGVGRDPDETLQIVASLELAANHRIAKAVIDEARSRGLPLSPPALLHPASGHGISGLACGRRVSIGSRAFILGSADPPLWAQMHLDRYYGQPVLAVFCAIDGEFAALLLLSDALQPEAGLAIQTARSAAKVETILVTGDAQLAAARVQSSLGLDRSLAEIDESLKSALIAIETSRHETVHVTDKLHANDSATHASVSILLTLVGEMPDRRFADVIVPGGRLTPVSNLLLIARRSFRNCMAIMMGISVMWSVLAVAVALGYAGIMFAMALRVFLIALSLAVICWALLLTGSMAQGRRAALGDAE